MAKTFHQLWLMGKGGPWELKEREIPTPGPGEVLVRMTASSICNQTDLNTVRALHPPHDHQITRMLPHHFRIWDNRVPDALSEDYPARKYPLEPFPTTMGHEGTGVVVAVGPLKEEPKVPILTVLPSSNHFKVGDRVAMFGTIGGFGEYVVADVNECVKVADNVTDDQASLLEPANLTCAMARQTIRYNDTVVILGQGALGLFVTQYARIFGARQIIVSDKVPMKLELAKKFGADVTVDATKENIVHVVEELTDGEGADVVIECAGEPETIRKVPYLGRLGARIGCIGACCNPVSMDWSYIHFRGYTVYSTTSALTNLGGMPASGKFTMDMMASGKMDLDSMITHRIPLTVEATNEIFKKIEKGDEVIKAIYVFDK